MLLRTSLAVGLIAVASFSFANNKVSDKPWLREYLPESITAYARIPHSMFFFSEANTPLEPLYTDAEYAKTVLAVQQGLLAKLNDLELNQQERAMANLFLSHLRAPVELVVPEYVKFSQPPTVLLATKLDYPDAESFSKDFAQLFAGSPVALQPEQNGTGQLIIKQAPLQGHYEYQPQTGKLLIVLSQDTKAYQSLINADAKTTSPIARSEGLIDDNAQGFFAVLNPSPMMFAMLPLSGEQKAAFVQLGLNQIKTIAVGFGVAQKRPKLSVMVDMPNTGLRKLIPAYPAHTDVAYQGELSAFASLSLPNEAILKDAITQLSAKPSAFEEAKQAFAKATNLELSDVLALIGRNFTTFTDDNDTFIVTDSEFADRLIPMVKNAKLVTVEELEIDGNTITHLNLSPFFAQLSKGLARGKEAQLNMALLSLLVNNHIYWMKEGDKLLINTLPQPLVARSQRKASGKIIEQFNAHQLSTSAAFITSMVNFRNLSQQAYYNHLRLLDSLSDVAGVPSNIAHYPTANTYDFAQHGAVTFSISNDEVLMVSLSTENGIIDMIHLAKQAYSQMGTVSFVGILSAIAIPAYQDYLAKSQVVRSVAKTMPLQMAVSERIAEGKPLEEMDSESLAQAIDESAISSKAIESVYIAEGVIFIEFSSDAPRPIRYETLMLTPQVDKGAVTKWECTDLPEKYLPSSCRQ